MHNKKLFLSLAIALGAALSVNAFAAQSGPLTIKEQGSFAAGGTVIEAKEAYNPIKPEPAAQTLHGDHAYVSYQLPMSQKHYPLVFLHGAGQSSKTWGTTPDGREGFNNIFLRRGYGVYLVDQPRRGKAGRSTVSMNINAAPDEQFWFGQFRLGVWPKFYEGTQFPHDSESMNQFFRQMTPNTGPYDEKVISDAMKAVFDRIGPGVLVTHSQGCGPGWRTAIKSSEVKGIVAFEPGSGFVFPKGEVPKPIPNSGLFGPFKAQEVPMEDFMKLTKVPIVIFYGDNIPNKRVSEPHKDYWRAATEMADKFAETINSHGGDAKVVRLPSEGLKGNTHFLFADKNNEQVADLMSNWLKEKGLDK